MGVLSLIAPTYLRLPPVHERAFGPSGGCQHALRPRLVMFNASETFSTVVVAELLSPSKAKGNAGHEVYAIFQAVALYATQITQRRQDAESLRTILLKLESW